MGRLIDFQSDPIACMLPELLRDHATGGNIVFASDGYGHATGDEMSAWDALSAGMRPSAERPPKGAGGRIATPAWLANSMANRMDEALIGRQDAFNVAGKAVWVSTFGAVRFDGADEWKEYVGATAIEIACAEAPFTASRYDMATGSAIHVRDRVGILDRKLRVVGENTFSREAWIQWASRAVRSCYGYEREADGLLLARCNVLMDYCEHYASKWKSQPGEDVLLDVCDAICRNFWQMGVDAGTRPVGGPYRMARDWQPGEDARLDGMRFGSCLGNLLGSPSYHASMDLAHGIAERAWLIHPGGFLLRDGSAPAGWTDRALADENMKAIGFWRSAKASFPGTGATGCAAMTYRDASRRIGPIGTFSPFPELSWMLRKVRIVDGNRSILDAMYPEPGKGLPDQDPAIHADAGDDDVEVICLRRGRRDARYVDAKIAYGALGDLDGWRTLVPVATKSGRFGGPLDGVEVVAPGIAHSESFVSFGKFGTKAEAEACAKYLATRFARALLGSLKVSKETPRDAWRHVPPQDFTGASDIRWDEDVAGIDRQLYRKYGLSDGEIRFLESKVARMR